MQEPIACGNPSKEKEREVVLEINELSVSVGRVSENFITLRKRLDTACQTVDEAEQDKEPDRHICLLANAIRAERKRIDALNTNICRTLDVLQI